MRINIRDITDEVIEEYDLLSYVEPDGYVYFGIYGTLYGLSQSGRIAHDDLKQNLEPHGYYPSKRTPGLWLHRTRPISFTLVVDDFGVKYINKSDADHLFDAIKTKYPVKIDWTGNKYLGINLKWNYKKRYVTLSMKGYNLKKAKEFNHPVPTKHTYGPTIFVQPEYGKKYNMHMLMNQQNYQIKR